MEDVPRTDEKNELRFLRVKENRMCVVKKRRYEKWRYIFVEGEKT